MRPRLPLVLGTLALLLTAAPSQAQLDGVGSIQFPTSAKGEAQDAFLRGVAILHSFGWKQAIEQFQHAQKADPNFALAYWGESLSYNHPLFPTMNPDAPRQVLQRLAPTKAERLAKAPTDREKGFLNAVEMLWGEGSEKERRVGYMEAMQRLHEAYPDDPEAAAFYSLSMLSAVSVTRDLSMRLNVRAGTIALKLLEQNRDHPGAAHYTIHSFDSPVFAPLALDAADRFAEIAPAVSHARHMPTHIFIQHGMWDRVSYNNQSAFDAARDLWQPGDALNDAVHALDWGQYGDLQRGDYEKARVWAERLDKMVANEGFAPNGRSRAMPRAINTVSLLKARYIVDTGEWELQPVTDESPPHELLATAVSAWHLGDAAAADRAEAALGKRAETVSDDGRGAPRYAKIMHKQAAALSSAGSGDAEAAFERMDEAIEILETMAPPRGSASPVKPVHELYGELLLSFDQAGPAVEMFETSLLRMPRRPRSLLGLARASAQVGDHDKAARAYAELTEVWEGRELFDGMKEARRYLASTPEH